MLTTINELFVFVPAGMGQTFIKRYATDEAYKKKIAFVEETGEIYTNGKCFGTNYKSAIDELSGKVQEVQGKNESAIDELSGKIQKVQEKNDELTNTLNALNANTIKEINDWIKQHGANFSTLSASVEQNKGNIATLTNDISKLQKDLEDLNKISIWQEFVADSDMPPVTEATKIIDTKESLDSLENTENEDIAVTSNDAMEYFNNVAAKTFKNITL